MSTHLQGLPQCKMHWSHLWSPYHLCSRQVSVRFLLNGSCSPHCHAHLWTTDQILVSVYYRPLVGQPSFCMKVLYINRILPAKNVYIFLLNGNNTACIPWLLCTDFRSENIVWVMVPKAGWELHGINFEKQYIARAINIQIWTATFKHGSQCMQNVLLPWQYKWLFLGRVIIYFSG